MKRFFRGQEGIAIGLFVVSVALAGIGIAFVGVAQHASSRARFATEWPSVTGNIQKAGVDEKSGAPEIAYAYQVGDKSYEGSRIFLSEGPYEEVKEVPGGTDIIYPSPDGGTGTLRLREGNAVDVRYNPDNPADSVLQPSLLGSMRKFLLIGIAAVLFAMFAGARSFFYE